MTTKIATRIKEFNDTLGRYHQLTVSEKASPDQITVLQQYSEIPIPEDLRSFYLELGGLTPNDDECWNLQIDEVPYLLDRLNDPDKWGRCNSLGIIDYIRLVWVNDRWELDRDEYLTGEQIDLLNKSYKCFGTYRTNWGFEEADYLYYDRDGKFGTVRYHQDYIHELVPRLLLMLEKSPATEDLEGMLLRILDTVENGILSEKD